MTSSDSTLLLLGAGGHAVSCIDVIEREGRYRIAGLVGQSMELGKLVSGYAVVITDESLDEGLTLAKNLLVAVGQIRSPDVRKNLFERARKAGFSQPVILSPLSQVSSRAQVAAGTVIMHGSIVNTAASVGENCIVNTRALIEHGVRVGSHCHISTGAIINGDAHIADGCFVGSGAVVREGIYIGERCVIGMGAVVRQDLPAGTVFKVRRDDD